MLFLDLTLPDLPANLALDEALLLEADEGGPATLRLWESPTYAVVLGAGCRLIDDVDDDACSRDGVAILRRSSGGGTVLLGPGCLLFSLVLPLDMNPALEQIQPSYAWILSRVAAALGGLAPGIAPAGISDLAIGDKKCSGNSQQRKRKAILHHGTLLYEFDVDRAARYLHAPNRQPDYRRRRSHAEFLINVQGTREELSQRLCDEWRARESTTRWPQEAVGRLVREKYGERTWIRRR